MSGLKFLNTYYNYSIAFVCDKFLSNAKIINSISSSFSIRVAQWKTINDKNNHNKCSFRGTKELETNFLAVWERVCQSVLRFKNGSIFS